MEWCGNLVELLDGVSLANEPLDEFTFGDAFSDISQMELDDFIRGGGREWSKV